MTSWDGARAQAEAFGNVVMAAALTGGAAPLVGCSTALLASPTAAAASEGEISSDEIEISSVLSCAGSA